MSQKPNWSLWADILDVKLDDAVALSCNAEPNSVPESDRFVTREQAALVHEFGRRLRIARSHAGKNLRVERHHDQLYVNLLEFRVWAATLRSPFEFPSEFPASPAIIPPATDAHWPWGNHETELLAVLAGAANRFWKNYDPSQPDTAAKSEAVGEWIRRQKAGGKVVARRVAEVMAQILRADGLRTGPR